MQDAKRRAIIFTVISVVLAGMAGILFLQKESEITAGLGNQVTMYVAAKPINARQPLKPSDFKAVPVPERYAMDSVVTNLDQIALDNQTYALKDLVTVVPLKANEPLTTNILKPAKDMTIGNDRMVALAKSDKVNFDEPISVNDRVDIIVSHQTSKNADPVTEVLMPDVKVVATSPDGNVIGLEMSRDDAIKLIHEENFAISIRVLKAPQISDETKKSQGESNIDREDSRNKVIPPKSSGSKKSGSSMKNSESKPNP